MRVPGQDNRSLIRFGHFELDTHSGELRRRGVKLKLPHQAYCVLRILLDSAGQVVTRDDLKLSVWPERKSADFDSGINKAVSQLRTLFGDGGPNPRFIETLPKRGYRFIAPLAPVPSAPAAERAIAVLPFENLTGDPSMAYLADGVADALTTGLGGLQGIRVITRTSAKASAVPGKSLQSIGRDLGVTTVVEGSVMRSGVLRVNLRLAEIGTDRVVWQGRYDSEPANLLALCDRLIEAVAREIGVQPKRPGSPARGPRRPTAHLAYLKGRYHWNKRTEEDLYRGIDEFQRALAIDPEFALAHAGLADAYVLIGIWGLEPSHTAFGAARNAAERAIELDDNLAEAHACRAEVLKDYEWDFIGAEKGFRRAIALNPNYSTAHHCLAQLLVTLGRFAEAADEIEFARRVDPFAPSINAYVPYIYLAARDYRRAVDEGQRAVELEPASPLARWQFGRALLFAGDATRAAEELETASALAKRRPMWLAELCFARARSGDRSGAEAIQSELTSLAEHSYVSPYDLAVCAAGMRDCDHVLDQLERAYEQRVMRLIAIGDPEFDAFRGDPRFLELSRRLHLPPADHRDLQPGFILVTKGP